MASLHPDWVTDDQGGRSWPVDHYQVEGQRTTDWLSAGVIKQHRTLGTLVNLLIDSGFRLDRLIEWGPSAQDLATHPALADEIHRPMMLIVAASRRYFPVTADGKQIDIAVTSNVDATLADTKAK